jgi:lipopolysaccharide/colanic/teichoic acid biosynthesis glycosyltransferase
MRRFARPLLYLGTIAIVVGLGRYHAEFVGHYYFHSAQRLPWNLSYAGFLCFGAYGMSLPDLDRKRHAWGPCIAAAFLGAAPIGMLQLILGSPLLPRFVLITGGILAVPWFAICVGIADIGREREEERDRVILVASVDEQAALEAQIGGMLERPASLVVSLTAEEAHASDPQFKPLVVAAMEHHATLLVMDRASTMDETTMAQAASLHESGVRVRSLSAFYEGWLGKLPLSELERMSLMFDVGELHRARYGKLKRACDVVAGLVGITLVALAIPFVFLGNMIGNRGPLFYRQDRVGRGGRNFVILKFRTMKPGSSTSEWTGDDDDRITPFGAFLRRSHLDELPQMVNIVRGDLSVVGPRPEQPRYVAELSEKIPFYGLRHLVRPGLTGWAQVMYRYGASEADAGEKLQYDFFYLRHQGLRLDFRIFGRTVRTVFGRTGR